MADDLTWIGQNAPKSQGKADYILYRKTGRALSPTRAVKAMCFHCACYYLDGKVDCMVTDCPLYPFMPYAHQGTEKPKRAMTEKQREAVAKLNTLRYGKRKNATSSDEQNSPRPSGQAAMAYSLPCPKPDEDTSKAG